MSDDPIAEMAAEFATAAVDLAREMHIKLDFSEKSLQHLEQILAQLHDDMHAGSTPVRSLDEPHEAPTATDMAELSKLWGSYFGEVVRRRWGGEWTIESHPRGGFSTLTLTVGGHKLFPSMKVYRRLMEGADDNLWDFYQQVRPKLEALPGRRTQ